MKTVKEFAALTGVSIRTLHYYDEIRLLRPASVTDSGYRLYGQQELERLQQILFLRELRFSLKEIAQILDDPTFDKRQALHQHRQLLLLQRQRLDELIRLADNTLKGGSQMNFDLLKHDPAREMQEEYANEVRQRWGNIEAYAESQRKTAGYQKSDWQNLLSGMESIFDRFADLAREGADPASTEAQELVENWRDYISENMYTCTPEILHGLGQMYVCDERFTKNLDSHGEGCAQFMSRAIEIYCK